MIKKQKRLLQTSLYKAFKEYIPEWKSTRVYLYKEKGNYSVLEKNEKLRYNKNIGESGG